MSTNLDVITAALREINVLNEFEAPSAEQSVASLKQLNDLMETWAEKDIKLGYFEQTGVDATCPVPKWSERAVKSALAIELSSLFGLPVSTELAAKYTDAYAVVLRKAVTESLTGADMSHMPSGSGKFGYGYNIETDA